ncbi:39S ribosomal protein L42, mitochondrial [Sitodiplosis mosellana]|uniref:39S ribosomal protein L42, mitochondrial n=1 Tax=Sitodiplosis mosellana TaxID=263140 RepID=UPI002444CA62|nr:39S ribosomal protein L42, mitochondrial [Sitodiplosis mosellana]
MAALRLNSVKNLTKHFLNGNCYTQIRPKSSNVLTTALGSLSTVEKVVTTSDDTTFISWHPTHDFPYEYSKPLPPPAIPTSTLLKDEAIQRSMEAFGSKHPEIARQELMKLTCTSKHVWKPRQRDRKAKNTPPDREYL